MERIRTLGALVAILAILGAETASAAPARKYERGPEKVTIGAQNGQQGYWVEYEEYTYESAADRLAAAAKGKLTAAELATLAAKVKKGGKTFTVAEINNQINAIVKARPKAKKK
jgi:hypothetical protein